MTINYDQIFDNVETYNRGELLQKRKEIGKTFTMCVLLFEQTKLSKSKIVCIVNRLRDVNNIIYIIEEIATIMGYEESPVKWKEYIRLQINKAEVLFMSAFEATTKLRDCYDIMFNFVDYSFFEYTNNIKIMEEECHV